jgi:hypothetical protein
VSCGLQHPFARLTTDPTIAELFASYCTALEPRKHGYTRQKWSPIAPFWRARLLSNTDSLHLHIFAHEGHQLLRLTVSFGSTIPSNRDAGGSECRR